MRHEKTVSESRIWTPLGALGRGWNRKKIIQVVTLFVFHGFFLRSTNWRAFLIIYLLTIKLFIWKNICMKIERFIQFYSILPKWSQVSKKLASLSFASIVAQARRENISDCFIFFKANFGLFSIVKKYEYDNRVFQNHVLKIRNYRN